MTKVKVWDPLVRSFHWAVVVIVFINTALVQEGDLHEWLGYAVVALLAVRVLWGFVGTHYARFSSFLPTRARLRAHLAGRPWDGEDASSGNLGHNPLGAIMIFNLMVTLALLGLTGHLMTTHMFWGSELMEELHEGLVGYLLFSIAVHVLGVIAESVRSHTNLVSAMITGMKERPRQKGAPE